MQLPSVDLFCRHGRKRKYFFHDGIPGVMMALHQVWSKSFSEFSLTRSGRTNELASSLKLRSWRFFAALKLLRRQSIAHAENGSKPFSSPREISVRSGGGRWSQDSTRMWVNAAWVVHPIYLGEMHTFSSIPTIHLLLTSRHC